jgi:maleate cis-trans isomerase
MAENPRHYTVGLISPTDRPEGRETQLDDKLPSNIRTISLSLNFTRGTEEEFGAAMPAYESKVAELAATKADLIIPGGAPPFMLLGFQGEREIIRSWEKKYGIPMFTSGQNHIRALKTLNLHKFVGASYFPQKLNAVFERYFTEAGFRVLEREGIHVPFADVPKLQGAEIFDHIKGIFDKHRDRKESTCWVLPGKPWISSRSWSKPWVCPWSTLARHGAGRHRSGLAFANPFAVMAGSWHKCRKPQPLSEDSFGSKSRHFRIWNIIVLK